MKKCNFISIIIIFILLEFTFPSLSQNLDDLLNDNTKSINYIENTFKTTRIVNGHSIESPDKGELVFIISHDFGRINQGFYEFFGLDQGTIRLGFEYSPYSWLCLGIGRSSYQKTYDGFIKAKLLRQSSGNRNVPVSISYFGDITLNSLKWAYPDRTNYFSSRLSFVHEVLIARKFNKNFSLQLTPAVVHRNLVEKASDKNDIFALGSGFRYKITNRTSINGEYFYVFPNQLNSDFHNSVSLGIDIETGGHVFQIHVSNSQGMFDRAFITETKGNPLKGDLYFGFNITRTFNL